METKTAIVQITVEEPISKEAMDRIKSIVTDLSEFGYDEDIVKAAREAAGS